ncbi:phenylacetate-CoA oxygenase subunit PaaJ [Chlorobiota bacterium]|nr:phenylacetate-CoA oxygenase subunit PaaJ [Chlorobiota bacterium]
MTFIKEDILKALEQVSDPEIPTVSIVDLGIITDVQCNADSIAITMTPTFVGCPAIDVMKQGVAEVLSQLTSSYSIDVNYDIPWDSNRISEKGRQALKTFGLAPPPTYDLVLDLEILHKVSCPYCNSANTEMQTPFGPTLCRSIHYCHSCLQAFEQFKPV